MNKSIVDVRKIRMGNCENYEWTAYALSGGYGNMSETYCDDVINKKFRLCKKKPGLAGLMCPDTCRRTDCGCKDQPLFIPELVDENATKATANCKDYVSQCTTSPAVALVCEATCGCSFKESDFCGKFGLPDCLPSMVKVPSWTKTSGHSKWITDTDCPDCAFPPGSYNISNSSNSSSSNGTNSSAASDI